MPKIRAYDKDNLKQAISDVQNKRESYRSAEKKYGIPRSTIEFKIKHPECKGTFGPVPILTEEEENTLVEWVKDTARKGFPRKANDLKSSVQKFLTENPRKNPFTNNRPGDGWLKAFLRRHPEIPQRTSEGVTSASACVAEKDIRNWFSEINDYIQEHNLATVIADPSRVFNGDESGFQICPTTGKVFAARGSKNVYTVDRGSSKENITVMFTFSADGNVCVPMVIYPYQRIPDKIANSINPEWGIGRSENGWMTTETFYEYIANVFHPHLVQRKVQFPVILFLDGHKSHLNYSLSLLCNELQIEVFALYPNATRILQPCDVAVFRPLKEAWRRSVREWEEDHPGEVLTKVTFAPLLEKAIKSSVRPEILVNGFRACGLCPMNPNAIDFSKCLGGTGINDNHQEEPVLPEATMNYSTFVEIVGQDRIDHFKEATDLPDETFKIWKYFDEKLNPDKYRNKFVSTGKINILQHIKITPAVNSTNNDLGIISRIDEPLTRFPEPTEMEGVGVVLHEITNSPKASSSIRVESPFLGDFLVSPETPQRKGKRNIERFPFAITSKKYQDMCKKKRELKEKAEKDKEDRKRKREEKLKVKNERAIVEKDSKKRVNKRRDKKNKEDQKHIKCFVCHGAVEVQKDCLKCDDCKKYAHRFCIPKTHKQHIPDEEDEDDIFMCHICYKENDNDSHISEISGENFQTDDAEVDELFALYQKNRPGHKS